MSAASDVDQQETAASSGAPKKPEPVVTAGSYHLHAQLQGAVMSKALDYIKWVWHCK